MSSSSLSIFLHQKCVVSLHKLDYAEIMSMTLDFQRKFFVISRYLNYEKIFPVKHRQKGIEEKN